MAFRPGVWTKNMDGVLKQFYDKGSLQEEQLLNWMAQDLHEAINSGSPDFSEIEYSPEKIKIWKELHQNTFKFTVAKYQDVADRISKIEAPNKADFVTKAMADFKKTHLNWLWTERRNATAAAQMAFKWQQIEEEKHILPNLRYVTAGDERVRSSHQAIDGVVLPIDHPFWETNYTPNGHNCRCDVEQTDAKPTEGTIPKISVDKGFKRNVGKDRNAFSNDHPYYDRTPEDKGGVLRNLMLKAINLWKPTTLYKSPSGGSIKAAITHNIEDLSQHSKRSQWDADLKYAKPLADNGYRVELMGHTFEDGVTNLDAKLNGHRADFKEPGILTPGKISKHGIYNAIRSANKQGADTVILYLNDLHSKKHIVGKQLRNAFVQDKNSSIHVVVLVYELNEIVNIKRKDIVNGNFWRELK